MELNDLENCKKNIFKTGFPLEFKLSQILESHGWSLIHNRYYFDEIEQIEKEIDIIAYKVCKLSEFRICTILIISSKKSESDYWGFLTKEFRKKDPNLDLLPIHNSTNNVILNFMLENYDWKKEILSEMNKNLILKNIYDVSHNIFAFQQMNKNKNKPQDDKNIFLSIRSLIRSEVFEIENLSDRVKDQHIYNFNLISVADTEFIKFHFESEEPDVSEINQIKYLNRYITKKKDDFYKVDFVTFKKFDEYLRNYDDLHDWNVDYYLELYKTYFKRAIFNDSYRALFEKRFIEKLEIYLKIFFRLRLKTPDLKPDQISLSYNLGGQMLEIMLDADKKVIDSLNRDDRAIKFTKTILNQIYRYNGDFIFGQYVPF